jgi:hypothetical protein
MDYFHDQIFQRRIEERLRMRLVLAVLAVMTLVKPALAADEPGPDMMDWYQDQRKATLERTLQNEQKYKDRWVEHVQERYGITLDKATPDSAEEADAADKDDIAAAKKLFERYKSYERAYDPAMAELYSEDARLDLTAIHQSGAVGHAAVSGDGVKRSIIKSLKIAKVKGEEMTYKDVSYEKEGDGIRIAGTISFKKKKFTMPWSILVEPDEKGAWLIMEETVEHPIPM